MNKALLGFIMWLDARFNTQDGFTLVELIVALFIISIIVLAIAGFGLGGYIAAHFIKKYW